MIYRSEKEHELSIPNLPNMLPVREQINDAVVFRITGSVAAVTGDVVELNGIAAPLGAICEISTMSGRQVRGRVIGFRGVRPLLAPLDSLESVAAGDCVVLLENHQSLPVGDSLCGRVVDALGEPIDGVPLPLDLPRARAEQNAPLSLDRPPVDRPFQTGVRVIDGMLTCGCGQRLGIFAGSGVGKSTLLGMIAKVCKADRIVIGMVGERGREVKEFLESILGAKGMERSVVVVATSDKPAAQRVSAAWTATSIAESFRDQGHHVLLLIDSVTRFATAQRELGLAAGEPPTTRCYPPSVFQSLPKLVERAGCSQKGMITAFYTVLVEGDDPHEPIADALRGLLDGHLVLSRDLAEEAIYPPVDVLQSISRLQPRLVSRDVLDAVTMIRRCLADHRKNADLISIGAYKTGSNHQIDEAIEMNNRFREYLSQDWMTETTLVEAQTSLKQLVDSSGCNNSAAEKLPTADDNGINQVMSF